MGSPDLVPAVVVRAADGEHIAAAGIDHLFKLTGATTRGAMGFETFAVQPGSLGARPHIHRSHDETFFVIAGGLTVITAEGETVLGPGDLAHAPRGAVHGFRNDHPTALATGLCVFNPAGYEQYFRDVHAAAESGIDVTDEVLARLRTAYDTEGL